MANFQVAELQARAQRAARDLAHRFLHCPLDELDAIEEQEAEVRYRFRCIYKVMRCSHSRCSKYGASKCRSVLSPDHGGSRHRSMAQR